MTIEVSNHIDASSRAAGRDVDRTAELIAVLRQQYDLLETRRRDFGRAWMQTVGFCTALFGGLVGLLGAEILSYDQLFESAASL